MLSINALNNLGAETADGLARCMNNETFYFRLIGIGIKDANFELLREKIRNGDLAGAFESAHALKGVMANLALTNISAPVSVLTEELRAREEKDYMPQVEAILAERDKVAALIG